VTLKAWQYK